MDKIKIAKIKIAKIDNKATIPTRATDGSAGYDLYANIDIPVTIYHNSITQIPTGIKIAIPNGYVGLIYARSGMAIKNGIVPANCVGVIDSDYRGEVIVAITNTTNVAFSVKPGMKIAQLIIAPIATPDMTLVESLDETGRSDGRFGSTG